MGDNLLGIKMESLYFLVTLRFPAATGLKASYLEKDRNAKTLLQAFLSHNKRLKQRLGSDVSKSTFSKYETVKGKLTSYLTEKHNRKDILLKELDYQFILQFELYLEVILNLNS